MNKLLLVALITFSACASVRPPTGGEKDLAPPLLESSAPLNNTTNYTGDRILLVFNERIQLNSPNTNILISPPLKEKPEIKMTGSKELSIRFKETLRQNTTYTINLSEAVADLTENNNAINTSFVFSTGPQLDSLSINGRVIDALNLEPEAQVQVILIPVQDTLNITNSKPYYLARTQKNGTFSLNNLKAGNYHCYALTDLNGNSKYDLPKEKIGFVSSSISLPDSSGNIELRMFVANAQSQQINDYSVNENWGLRLISAIASDSISVKPINDIGKSSRFIKEHVTGSDTSLFWPSDTTLLKGQRLLVLDKEQVIDTITYRPKNSMPFYISLRSKSGKGNAMNFTTSRPFNRLDSSRFRWIPDSLGNCEISETIILGPRTFQVRFANTKSSAIRALPGLVRGNLKGQNDTTVVKAETLGPKSFGSIEMMHTSPINARAVFELIASNGSVKNRILYPSAESMDWKDLVPGEYQVRRIIDVNKNGMWDTGDFQKGLQPEPVTYYPETITVRAGWKLELTWGL